MEFYHPQMEQRVGTVIGGVMGFFGIEIVDVLKSPRMDIVINTIIGATVGFIVTTFWRYVWEKFKIKWSKK